MKRNFRSFLAAAALLAVGLLASCAGAHVAVGYRYYDPGYGDYHVWNDGEVVFYNQWVIETHRPSRDFRRLNQNDQRAYWRWRHNHPDHR